MSGIEGNGGGKATHRLFWPNNWVDAGSNLSNPSTPPYGTIYETPATGNYVITASCWYEGIERDSDGTSSPVDGWLFLRDYTAGLNLAQSPLGNGNGFNALLNKVKFLTLTLFSPT